MQKVIRCKACDHLLAKVKTECASYVDLILFATRLRLWNEVQLICDECGEFTGISQSSMKEEQVS